MSQIKLSKANTIIREALKKAAELGLKPLAVAVLDAGGHLRAYQSQDGSSILRPQIAQGKAYGALAMGMGSRAINRIADERPSFAAAAIAMAGGALVPVPGGVLIRARNGDIIGAVGVTGDTSDNDETCAIAGITAAGFTADQG